MCILANQLIGTETFCFFFFFFFFHSSCYPLFHLILSTFMHPLHHNEERRMLSLSLHSHCTLLLVVLGIFISPYCTAISLTFIFSLHPLLLTYRYNCTASFFSSLLSSPLYLTLSFCFYFFFFLFSPRFTLHPGFRKNQLFTLQHSQAKNVNHRMYKYQLFLVSYYLTLLIHSIVPVVSIHANWSLITLPDLQVQMAIFHLIGVKCCLPINCFINYGCECEIILIASNTKYTLIHFRIK